QGISCKLVDGVIHDDHTIFVEYRCVSRVEQVQVVKAVSVVFNDKAVLQLFVVKGRVRSGRFKFSQHDVVENLLHGVEIQALLPAELILRVHLVQGEYRIAEIFQSLEIQQSVL